MEQERSHLPWILSVLLIIVGGAKLDAARPYLAQGIALALPPVAVSMGIYRLRDSEDFARRAALWTGCAAIIAAEICILAGFFGLRALTRLLVPGYFGLLGASAAALGVHALSLRSGVNARFGAWVGMATCFAAWLAGHRGPDLFGSVFIAFLLAFVGGGGGGLIASEVVRHFVRSRAR